MQPERAEVSPGAVDQALRRAVEAALAGGARFLVAYSAGPDSSALLAAAAAACLPGLAAAYVDHGLRPPEEREAELALARRTCARLGLPLTVARVRPGAIEDLARREGIGVEAAARQYRYRALRSAAGRRGASLVLMAHTLDDRIETALSRFLGGSGAGGLGGIPRARGPFLRPFLGLTKAELGAYALARGIESSRDSTNASPDFSRNRLRLELAPLLDARFPGWRRGVLLASEKAALEDEALARAAAPLAFSHAGPGRVRADAAPLLGAPRALAARSVVEAAGLVLGRARISSRLALAALDALSRGCGYRGGGLALSLEKGRVEMARALDFPRSDGYFVCIHGPCRIRVGPVAVKAFWSNRGPGGRDESRGIRADAFSFPLTLRSRRPGDELALPGGTKRLDEILSEMGLAPGLRDRVPVAEDRDGIVAALGSAFGAGDRFRRGPRIVEGEAGPPRLVIVVKGA